MYSKKQKNGWALFLLLLMGMVIGSVLGGFAEGTKYFGWVNNGPKYTIPDIHLDFNNIVLDFVLKIKITIGSIIGTIIAIITYSKL